MSENAISVFGAEERRACLPGVILWMSTTMCYIADVPAVPFVGLEQVLTSYINNMLSILLDP